MKVRPLSDQLISVDEKEEREAQHQFYAMVEAQMSERTAKKLKFWRRVSTIYSPSFVLIFMLTYWIAGLRHADIL